MVLCLIIINKKKEYIPVLELNYELMIDCNSKILINILLLYNINNKSYRENEFNL